MSYSTCHPCGYACALGKKRDLVHLVGHWFITNKKESKRGVSWGNPFNSALGN